MYENDEKLDQNIDEDRRTERIEPVDAPRQHVQAEQAQPVQEAQEQPVHTVQQPTVQVPQQQTPPVGNFMPPQNRYAYYSDGSRRYASPPPPVYSAYPVGASANAPEAKLSTPNKNTKAVPALIAVVCVLCVALLGLGIWLYLDRNADESATDKGEKTVLTNTSDGAEDKNEENISVKESVTVSPTVPQIGDDAVPEGSYGSLVELYNKCAPSCVSIISTVQVNYGFYTQEGKSLGSGFVVKGKDPETDEDAFYIITNHHVIDGAKSIEVKFYDEEDTYKATLVGSDELTDIAVLTIEKDNLIPLEIGDSKELSVGEWVVAIGTPSDEEFAGTMSYGIISGLDRDLKVTDNYGNVVKTMTVIQTTATLNPGNSGGPLINMAGQVVGINAMKLSEQYEGMGFALPSTDAVKIINNLIQEGEVIDRTDSFVTASAKLGISGMDVDEEVIDYYSLGDDCPEKGVLVSSVSRGTAVYEAGLSIYDVITGFNGVDIENMEQLQAELKKSSAGTTVTLTFFRPDRRGEEGEYQTISFKLDYAN